MAASSVPSTACNWCSLTEVIDDSESSRSADLTNSSRLLSGKAVDQMGADIKAATGGTFNRRDKIIQGMPAVDLLQNSVIG
jgi:hypothetical protein